ncbi:helix-turn-helix domain-containing protein [Streptomyces sp. NPDC085946]|uniref:AraC-like ligand-binding domain-containing protein n=1 Tax=Streptomyces sp. NPDC085946 TaxID=3365744 RepID=UPI0037D82648
MTPGAPARAEAGPARGLLTTARVPGHRRRAYWRDALSRTFGAVDMTVPEEVGSGTIRTAPLGRFQVVTVDGEPLRTRRTRRLVARGEDRRVVVKLLVRGAARLAQDGRDAAVRPGEVFVYDTARPVRLLLPQPFRTTSLVLPRHALALGEPDLRRITATPLRPDTALGALLATFLSRLADTADTLRPSSGELLARRAADLLTAVADERLGRLPADTPSGDAALLLRIRAYIVRHLADPGLTPAAVAAAHHISVRRLHTLFEAEGTTVGRWLLGRRLEASLRDLAHRRTTGLTIAAVAHRWGFTSAAHYSRVFRAAHGTSPSEWP